MNMDHRTTSQEAPANGHQNAERASPLADAISALEWIYENDVVSYRDCSPPSGVDVIRVTREETIARGPCAMKAKAALSTAR